MQFTTGVQQCLVKEHSLVVLQAPSSKAPRVPEHVACSRVPGTRVMFFKLCMVVAFCLSRTVFKITLDDDELKNDNFLH